jgi:hypothetical protein
MGCSIRTGKAKAGAMSHRANQINGPCIVTATQGPH